MYLTFTQKIKIRVATRKRNDPLVCNVLNMFDKRVNVTPDKPLRTCVQIQDCVMSHIEVLDAIMVSGVTSLATTGLMTMSLMRVVNKSILPQIDETTRRVHALRSSVNMWKDWTALLEATEQDRWVSKSYYMQRIDRDIDAIKKRLEAIELGMNRARCVWSRGNQQPPDATSAKNVVRRRNDSTMENLKRIETE